MIHSISPISFKVGDLNRGYINGEWVGQNIKQFDVLNPATNTYLSSVPDMGKDEVSKAIDAAYAAFPAWKAAGARERSKLIQKFCDLWVSYAEEIGTIITLENGKSIHQSKSEVHYAGEYLEWYAQEARRIYGFTINPPVPDKRIIVTREPVGVCGLISPWNFPVAMLARQLGAVLASGCTCVCKPAEDTPISALALAKVAEYVGIPKGVINIITCSRDKAPEVGMELCTNKKVKKIAFTGSTDVGKLLLRQASSTVKKVSLELGGNGPFICFPDVNIDLAVETGFGAKSRCSGQACTSVNRFYIHEDIFESYVQKYTEKTKSLKVGSGMNPDVDIGPVINHKAVEKISRLVQNAIQSGAKLILGGSIPSFGAADTSLKSGSFYSPTILDCRPIQANLEEEITTSEIFGPVSAFYSFKTIDEVIHRANNVSYGLGSFVLSNDINIIIKMTEALEYGMIAVNTPYSSYCEGPFGGVKESGLGREGSCLGLEEYTSTKYTCIGGII